MWDEELGGVRGRVLAVLLAEWLLGGAWDAVDGEEVDELGFGGLETEGAQGDTQFMVVEVAVAVEVKERELWRRTQ